MVAELAGIPVSTGVPGRSSKTKTSRILGIRRSNTCYSTSTASSATSERHDRRRPRWIRAATREPIYSVLDDREHTADRRLTPAPRTLKSGERLNEYEISAVRDRQKIGIFEESTVVDRATDRQEIEESDEEHALYSVVRKPPKIVFAEGRSKLPILQEEEPQDPREEILKRQKELHKWLQEASASGAGFEEAPARMSSEMEDSLDEKDDRREAVANRKCDDSWSPLGVSVPRGVVGMVGPFCRIYRNPNERREFMLKEEVEERGIDLGEDRQIEEAEDEGEEAATAVDTISEAGTFVDLDGNVKNLSTKPRDYEVDDESAAVEQQRHRRRAKWRIIEEGEVRDSAAKKMDADGEEENSTIKREWLKEEGDFGIVSNEVYDLEVPPKYSSRRSEGKIEFWGVERVLGVNSWSLTH